VTHVRKPASTDLRRGGHVLDDRPRTPPPAPRGLSAAERRGWEELWSLPVSALWHEGDGALVLRLVKIRLRLDAEGASAPVTLYSQASGLEDRLLLSPRARRSAGISIVEADTGRSSPNGPVRLKARERERLLRG
jgi:hypothetical protein